MFTASGWVDFSRMEDRILFGIIQDATHHRYVQELARDATRGRIEAAKEGRWNGGAPPYGYRVETAAPSAAATTSTARTSAVQYTSVHRSRSRSV
jgi:DNA invertase Pin-like site-specific DNA recombinase